MTPSVFWCAPVYWKGARPQRVILSTFTAVLRDGQTAQVLAGQDPQTGDVTTVDVTLTAPE
jgi:hypothetical protein